MAPEEVAFTRILEKRRERTEEVSSHKVTCPDCCWGKRARVTAGDKDVLEHIAELARCFGTCNISYFLNYALRIHSGNLPSVPCVPGTLLDTVKARWACQCPFSSLLSLL